MKSAAGLNMRLGPSYTKVCDISRKIEPAKKRSQAKAFTKYVYEISCNTEYKQNNKKRQSKTIYVNIFYRRKKINLLKSFNPLIVSRDFCKMVIFCLQLVL